MINTQTNTRERVLAAVLAVVMLIALIPANVFAVDEPTVGYATVNPLTGGTVTGDGTEKVTVEVKETTLQWVPADTSIGRMEDGWWVGVNVTAPAGFSEDATLKKKNNVTGDGTYSSELKFVDYRDTTNEVGLWFRITAEILSEFLAKGEKPASMYVFDWDADGVYEQEITLAVVPSEKIVLKKDTAQMYPYASAQSCNGGVVTGNGSSKVTVEVKETTLQWHAADPSVGRMQDGWWIGVDVTAPAGFSENATYKKKNNVTGDDTYGSVKKFVDFRDTTDRIGVWFPVSAEILTAFMAKGTKPTYTYAFDWNADGVYEQEVISTIDPSEKIVLVKEGYQVYPAVNFATVTPFTGGTVTGDGTAKVIVDVKETTLQWEPADASIGRMEDGWWVGVNVKAPAGFSEKATLKKKNNTAGNGAYGSELKFVDYRDTTNEVGLWFRIDAEILDEFNTKGVKPASMYIFDWDGDGHYEQEITLAVVPSEKIVLIKDNYQVYPVLHSSITVNKNEGGTVKLNNNEVNVLDALHGDNIDVVISANDGYWLSSVKINGEAKNVNVGDTTFATKLLDIREDYVIDVEFVKVYTVKITNNDKGIVTTTPTTAGGEVTVTVGTTFDIEATPSAHYRVSKVVINGAEQTLSGENDLKYVKSLIVDKTYDIEITFSKNIYTVTVENTANGSVTVSDNGKAEYEGSITVTIDPDDRYTIDAIDVNGVKINSVVTNGDKHTFVIENIDGARTVKVTFKKIADANKNDVKLNTEKIVRVDGKLNVFKNDADIIVSTEKNGIKLFDAEGKLLGGNETTKSVTLTETTSIGKIQLYYLADGEFYPEWHNVVEYTAESPLRLVKDTEIEAPTVTHTANANGYNNSNVTMNVVAKDKGSEYSGIAKIEYWLTVGTLSSAPVTLYEYDNNSTILNEKELTFVIDAFGEFNVNGLVATVKVTDLAGNVKESTDVVNINSTRPEVALDITGTQNKDAVDGYYCGANRVLTITITDREDTFSKANVLAGLKVKKNDQPVSLQASDLNWISDQVCTYTFDGDGFYTFEFSYTNLADMTNNGITAPSDKNIYEFVIDDTKPTDTKITYTPDFVGTVLENLTFGFYKAPVTVRIEAKDATSGVEYFVYSYTVQNGASSVNAGKEDQKVTAQYDSAKDVYYTEFEIPAQFRGTVSFTAVDKSENKVGLTDTDTNGDRIVVVDTTVPGVSVEFIDGLTAKNGKYYSEARKAQVVITEANFFDKHVASEKLVIKITKVDNDGNKTEEVIDLANFKFTKNGDIYTSEIITFAEDADYTMTVDYTDRSGNAGTQFVVDEFTVDNIDPVVVAKHTNNDVLNGKYFKAERPVEITITEHNFNAADVVVTVTKDGNTDGTYAAYLTNPANWTSVGNVHTANIKFTDDAFWTFDIAYTDLADRTDDKVEYEGEVPVDFCVDKTSATDLTISYEPTFTGILLENLTFGFYKAPVKVTIKAADAKSGLDYFVYSYAVQNGASNINVGEVGKVVAASANDDTEFVIPAQFRGTVSFTIFDKAGNSAEIVDTDANGNRIVVVDTKAPGVSVVFVNDPQAVNGKYYSKARNAQIVIEEANFFDKHVDSEALVIKITKVDNDGNKTEEVIDLANFKFTKNGDIYTSEVITFAEDADYTMTVDYTDRAGNKADTVTVAEFTIDNINPVIDVEYKNNAAENDTYFKAERPVEITITEHNFKSDEVVVTITKDGKADTTVASNLKWTSVGNVHKTEINFTDEADWTFDIAYTDLAGRKNDEVKYGASVAPKAFTVDLKDPTIDVEFDNNDVRNEKYFNADRTVTVVITEHNFRASDVVVNIVPDGDKNDQRAKDYLAYFKDANNWTNNGDVYTASVNVGTEAYWTFDVAYTDLAGRNNVKEVYADGTKAPNDFCIDKTAPTDLKIDISGESVLGTDNGNLTKDTVFNKFYINAVKAELSANFDISTEYSITYQKVASVSEYDENGTWLEYNKTEGIVVEPSEKFVIFFRAEDMAANVTIVKSTGIVVDNKEPVGEQNAPEIDILPEAPNENNLHKDDVKVDIAVLDPKYAGNVQSENGYYSGLNKITYTIKATDTGISEEGTLLDIANNIAKGTPVVDGDNLVKSWSGSIVIDSEKFNSNNVIVIIKAVDNAGNVRETTTKAGQIRIDVTAPVIDIAYDVNDGDTTFAEGTYFDSNRIATITVTERNFDPKDVLLTITNTDGKIPEISTWTEVKGTGNGDDTKYTATLTYDADGDYTFAIDYTDEAGNVAPEENYGTSQAPQQFTIDKTAPVVKVTYDNNNAQNGNYYNAQRVATITVTEHNFESSRIKIALTATDKGIVSKLPTVSNWKSAGDVHTATITYADDSLYTFDFDYNDKAGNATADIPMQTFYVDKTAPAISIFGVVDESANNDEGNIGFEIISTDTNFDAFAPVLTAVVKTENGFETKTLEIATVEDIKVDGKPGKKYTVANIEQDGIYRITCIVVDKAGNAFTSVTLKNKEGVEYVVERTAADKLVTFSVNREGSTFELDNNTTELVKQYYVQEVTNDVVVIEINADPLNEYKVTLNGKELVKGTDYKVTEDGGNGDWMKYTYTVSKSLFEKEGQYVLVVSSKDKAENDAFSDVKNATVNFVVDKTAPVITITGLANNGRYQTEKQKVTLIPTDDGGALNTLIVRLVDEEGFVVKELINLAGEALAKALETNGGKVEFEIEEGLYQNVQIICTDCAINGANDTNVYDGTVKNVSVSTSSFMIFWANKPLRWGVIGGTATVLAAAVALIIVMKKKKAAKATKA